MADKSPVVVTFTVNEEGRAAIAEGLAGAAETVYLADVAEAERAGYLSAAPALIAGNTSTDLTAEERVLIADAKLLQFLSAGIDFIRFDELPKGLPVACNAGAFAEPMAEHALAMTMAAAKRLLPEQRALERGEFNQFLPNQRLDGAVFSILGFGGIGKAAARLARCLGMRIFAINRSGSTNESVDFIGASDALDRVLAESDVLLISVPLTDATMALIGERELALMKPTAILVNLARGELVDERALYEHLRRVRKCSVGPCCDPFSGSTSGIEQAPTTGLVTYFAMRYRRVHGDARRFLQGSGVDRKRERRLVLPFDRDSAPAARLPVVVRAGARPRGSGTGAGGRGRGAL